MKYADKAFFTKLNAVSGLANKVFQARAPQNQQPPFVVFQRSDSQRWRSINGPSGMTQTTFQVDVYARTALEAKDLALAIEGDLDGFRGTVAYGNTSPATTLRIGGISHQGDFETIDQTDNPFLYRISADYLVTYDATS